jgi:hypothetical protein
VACELEGKSRREAALQLGLAEGTLSTHLARGRKLLRERLIQRGVSLGAGALASLPLGTTEAAVPDGLLGSTIPAAGACAPGGAASGGSVSATVAALTERVLKMMVLTKLTLLVAGALGAGLATLTACVAWAAFPVRSGASPQSAVATKAERAALRNQAAANIAPRRARAHRVVVDEAGEPAAGIEVRDSADGPVRGVTDERGRFDFLLPRPVLGGVWLLAGTADRTRQGIYHYDFELLDANTPQPVRITLKPSIEVAVRVTDKPGEPVPGAAVEALSWGRATTHEKGIAVLRLPADAMVDRIIGLKPGRGFDDFQHGAPWAGHQGAPARELPRSVHLVLDGARTVQVRAVDSAGKPLAGVQFSPVVIRKVGKRDTHVFTHWSEIAQARTDEHGIATFDWLPETEGPLFFQPRSEGY